MTAFLEVQDLKKHFPVYSGLLRRPTASVRAVDGVSFVLHEGETLGIVGESGCGKSTLVQTILYLYEPTAGEIRFRGQPVTAKNIQQLRRELQIVFQDPYTSLPTRMKVGDIVADPLRIHKVGDERAVHRKVQQILREVGLKPEWSAHYPFQFSGGQRQRIGIARALAIDPTLVVADESVSSLDVSVQAQILNLFRDLQDKHGLTYIFVSHDLGVVKYMSQRIAVMYLGKFVEVAPSQQVYDEPLHPYTRALLSAVPSLHRKRSERIRLLGEPPKPTAPPAGCRFHPRCYRTEPLCSQAEPVLKEWLPGRYVACHFALDSDPAVCGGLVSARPSASASEDRW